MIKPAPTFPTTPRAPTKYTAQSNSVLCTRAGGRRALVRRVCASRVRLPLPVLSPRPRRAKNGPWRRPELKKSTVQLLK